MPLRSSRRPFAVRPFFHCPSVRSVTGDVSPQRSSQRCMGQFRCHDGINDWAWSAPRHVCGILRLVELRRRRPADLLRYRGPAHMKICKPSVRTAYSRSVQPHGQFTSDRYGIVRFGLEAEARMFCGVIPETRCRRLQDFRERGGGEYGCSDEQGRIAQSDRV